MDDSELLLTSTSSAFVTTNQNQSLPVSQCDVQQSRIKSPTQNVTHTSTTLVDSVPAHVFNSKNGDGDALDISEQDPLLITESDCLAAAAPDVIEQPDLRRNGFTLKLPFQHPLQILGEENQNHSQVQVQKENNLPEFETIENEPAKIAVLNSDIISGELKKATLENHLISYTIDFFTCPECSLVFETEERLRNHEDEFHSDESIPVLTITEENTDNDFEKQVELSHQRRDLLCKLTQERVVRVSLVDICTRTISCETCGLSLPIVEMSKHRREHKNKQSASQSSTKVINNKKGLICPGQDAKTSLRLKMKIEAKTKPHQCRFCEKRFVSASQCKSHENAHSEIMTEPGENSNNLQNRIKKNVINSCRRRGRPPKNRSELDLSSVKCEKCCLIQCACNKSTMEINSKKRENDCELSELDVDLVLCNEKVIFNTCEVQLQGMPVLRPKQAIADESNGSCGTNSSDGPPELTPVELAESGSDLTPSDSGHDTMETCQTCGDEIAVSALLDHIRNHLDKGQRDCSLCDYKAHTHKDLKEHINKHYGLRPYECRYCDKTFSWETGLKRHLQTSHEEMTPHKCTHCQFRFETQRERRRHELTHKSISKTQETRQPRRRFSLNSPQSGKHSIEMSRRRSLNTPTPSPLEEEMATVEHELRKRSLYPIPEFSPTADILAGNFQEVFQPEAQGSDRDSFSEGDSLAAFPVGPAFPNPGQAQLTPIQESPDFHRVHRDSLSNDGISDQERNSTEKPDPRDSEKCKTCNAMIPIDELMAHVQSHIRPNQRKCDICNYEATSSKLLPEHMNIHYLLKPFQCSICKRRFAMKGYLRSHNQQVHESANNRRYACHFCDKRFVRPCHRKAHEKGVHLKEGMTPPEINPDSPERKLSPKDKCKSPKRKISNGQIGQVQSLPVPVPPVVPPPQTQPVFSTPQAQNYNMGENWTNSNQVIGFAGTSQDQMYVQQPQVQNAGQQPHIQQQHPQQQLPHQQQLNHQMIKPEAYWVHPQTQPQFHTSPPANSSHIVKPNADWTGFQTTTNEFDLKAPEMVANQYINTHHSQTMQVQNQGHAQQQDYNYGEHANAFNYQGYNVGGGIEDYSYSAPNSLVQNTSWSGQDSNVGLVSQGSSMTVNYGSYNPVVNSDCDNNIIGADARWSTVDPYGILQEQPVLHENTYTISRPLDPVVDLWAELRHEELKLFPENGFGSYPQVQDGTGISFGMQNQEIPQTSSSSVNSHDNVPLLNQPRPVPLPTDFTESLDGDGYSNNYFEGIPQISPDNLFEASVDGITDTLFDDMSDFAPDGSSTPSLSLGDTFKGSTSKAPCRTCGKKFLREDLIEHVRSHLRKGQKTCDICQHTFCSSIALRDHISTHYQFKPHQCLTCFKYFSTKHSLKNHIVCIHEGKREAKCSICNRTFTLVFSLRRHMRLVHKINPKNGMKLAPTEEEQHTRGQSNKRRGRQPKEPGSTRPRKVEKKQNVGTGNVQESDPVERSELHKKILERNWIVNLVDVGRNVIVCGFCGESVLVKDLLAHRYNHKDPCHICGKPVRISETLHHGITHIISLSCEICSKVAKTKSQCWEHYNTHLGLKPMKCNICGSAFASRTSLRTHFLARHTKFRPHQCNFCDRSFVQLSVKRIHEMTHYGTKCPNCGQEFERKKDLVIHMKDYHSDGEVKRLSSSEFSSMNDWNLY